MHYRSLLDERADLSEETLDKMAPGSRGTPTIDGDRIYIMSGIGVVSCHSIKDGKEIWVPRAISDPGPISDGDWIQVAPRTTKSFVLTSFPQNLKLLRPGTYEAHIRFWRDPFTDYSNAYDSQRAKFTVTE